MKTYTFHTDPGHGWLQVPLAEVEQLGLTGKISSYSYQQGKFAYLEEDCDAPLFTEKLDLLKVNFDVNEVYREYTNIRNMARFTGL